MVTSAHEVRSIKRARGEQFITVTPGSRPRWAAGTDHRRALTLAEALAAGADHLAIGRLITNPPPGDRRPGRGGRVHPGRNQGRAMSEQQALQILERVGAVLTGTHVIYNSGRHGDAYVNKDALYTSRRKIRRRCAS